MSELSPSSSKSNNSASGKEFQMPVAALLAKNEQWYEGEYEDAQIKSNIDATWLTSLADRSLTASEIEMLNGGTIAIGSVHINEGTDPLLVEEVVRAREQFYGEVLGWSGEDHLMHDVYEKIASQRQFPPLSTVIRTQRYLSGLGDLDGSQLIRGNPVLLSMSVDSIQPKVEHLLDLGIKDLPKLITSNPNVFSMEIGSLDEKLSRLSALGFQNPITLIQKNPAILNKAATSIASKLQAFEELGIKNPTQFVEKLPAVLGSSVDSITEKFSVLSEAGASDVAKLVEKRPEIMGLSSETIRAKLQNLTDIGFSDPGRLLEKFAAILTYSIDSVNSKIERLRAMGFHSPIEVFDKAPPLLGYSPETIEAKIQSFNVMLTTLNSSISSIELIENTPSLLGVADSKIEAITAFLSLHEFESKIRENPKAISKLFFIPVDSYVGAFAGHEEDVMTMSRLDAEARHVAPAERRGKSLESLSNPKLRRSIGSAALGAYLRYAPLSEQEKVQYTQIDE